MFTKKLKQIGREYGGKKEKEKINRAMERYGRNKRENKESGRESRETSKGIIVLQHEKTVTFIRISKTVML